MRSVATAEIIHRAPMTLEEWADMDEDEPGELVGGHLEEEELPDHLHEAVVAFLIRVLGLWASPRRAPVLGSEHKIGVAPKRGRKPDVSMYAPGTRLGRGALSLTAPLLAVEVLSPRPRDVRRDRRDKAGEYARFGVRLYLLVDPAVRLVELYELGADGRYILAASCSEGKLTLPGCEGLEIDLDAMWNEADWIIGDASQEERGEGESDET